MKYTVTGFNNFCRVFEPPDKFPSDFCFGGGIPVAMAMVDWFNPIPNLPNWAISKEKYDELVAQNHFNNLPDHERVMEGDEIQEFLTDFLRKKQYVKEGKKYLVLFNFGFSFVFEKNAA